MSACVQCGQAAPFWRRDLFTGLCAKCADSPGEEGIKCFKRRFRIIAVVLMAFAVRLIASFTPALDVIFSDEPFNSEKWIEGDPRVRGRMVRDLVRSGLLRGKTVSQIEAILGPGERSNLSFAGQTPVYLVDMGYRRFFQAVSCELRVDCPMSKFGDDTTEVSLDGWDGSGPDPFVWFRRFLK